MPQAGQFYTSGWLFQHPDPRQLPGPAEVKSFMCDLCAHSDADVIFDKMNFTVTGSDDVVKVALAHIYDNPAIAQIPCQIRVNIELGNEHKEFVSGKKNGKINKIMAQSKIVDISQTYVLSC